MITLESSTQSPEELVAALRANGHEVADPEPLVAVSTEESEQTQTPGGETTVETVVVAPAEGESKIAAGATDPAVVAAATPPPTQEGTQQGTETVVPEGERHKAKGGFQAKIDKLTRQLDAARDRLSESTDKEGTLQRRVDALQAELAGLKPVAAAAAPVAPQRPKRPKLVDFEGDFDKLEAAMEQYDTDLEKYNQELQDARVATALEEREAMRTRETAEREAQRQLNAFAERKNADAAGIEDFDEVIATLPADAVTVVDATDGIARGFIAAKAKHPARLIYYLAKDYLENDGAESARLAGLDAYDLLDELKRLDAELASSTTEPLVAASPAPPVVAPAAAAPAAVATPPVTPPAPPVKAPAAPLRTVGSRTTAKEPSMEDLLKSDPKAFQKRILSGLGKKYAIHTNA